VGSSDTADEQDPVNRAHEDFGGISEVMIRLDEEPLPVSERNCASGGPALPWLRDVKHGRHGMIRRADPLARRAVRGEPDDGLPVRVARRDVDRPAGVGGAAEAPGECPVSTGHGVFRQGPTAMIGTPPHSLATVVAIRLVTDPQAGSPDRIGPERAGVWPR